MTGSQVRAVIAAWLHEEAAEMAKTNRDAEELDALLDALGIILVALIDHDQDMVKLAHREYVDSQIRRGRSIDTAHQRLIAQLIDSGLPSVSSSERDANSKVIEARMKKKGFTPLLGDGPRGRDSRLERERYDT